MLVLHNFLNSPLDQFSVIILFPLYINYADFYPYLHHFFFIFKLFNYYWPSQEAISLLNTNSIRYLTFWYDSYTSSIFNFFYANIFLKFLLLDNFCRFFLDFNLALLLFNATNKITIWTDFQSYNINAKLHFNNQYFNPAFYFYDMNLTLFDRMMEIDVLKKGFGCPFPKSKWSVWPLDYRLNVLFGSKMPFHTLYDLHYIFHVLFTLPYTVLRGITVAFPDLTLKFFNFDFSITNVNITFFINSTFIFLFFAASYAITKHYIKPNRYQLIWDFFFKLCINMLKENIGKAGRLFFPAIFFLFIFILTCNLLGMIPYSYTLTSHLLITFIFAFISFTIINIIAIYYHGINILNLFLPTGSPILLAPLLIPIEFISYSFRVISLSVRLFANMMAGHTLLKVIIGFSWSMLTSGGILFITHFFPLIVVFLLIGLEVGVAIIQAYIFTILTCIYLSDGIHLH